MNVWKICCFSNQGLQCCDRITSRQEVRWCFIGAVRLSRVWKYESQRNVKEGWCCPGNAGYSALLVSSAAVDSGQASAHSSASPPAGAEDAAPLLAPAAGGNSISRSRNHGQQDMPGTAEVGGPVDHVDPADVPLADLLRPVRIRAFGSSFHCSRALGRAIFSTGRKRSKTVNHHSYDRTKH